MSRFPPEINLKIIEQVNFDPGCPEVVNFEHEYSASFKEDIRIFKVLNSIMALKTIISKYMSIWIMYPEEMQFDYLKYSETLKDLKNCTDSFFIITTDRPRGGRFTSNHKDHSPLIFDVHNFLGLETPQSGLCLGIDQETLLEKLVLLSEKRPKRIIELTLPHGAEELDLMEFWLHNKRIVKRHNFQPLKELLEKKRLEPLRRLTRIFVDFNPEFDVSIDHRTIIWFPISDYDEYDFDADFRKAQNLMMTLNRAIEFLSVSTEFWGPTPILNKISIDKMNDIVANEKLDYRSCYTIDEFLGGIGSAIKELWTDHHELLFHSEFYRVNRAPYYSLIETLSSKKWE